jgi:23S rRNA pseudouridine1911/1915/1917 synthase
LEKTYLAVVCGELTASSGEIRAPIARHASHRKRMIATDEAGRPAWTTYRVVERLLGASLVSARLHTGRTHQIRVHFQHIGHPVLGDDVYGKRQTRRLIELTGYTPPRLLLHAHRLTFLHPHTRRPQTCEAPIPPDFQSALTALAEAPSHPG